MRGLQKSKRVSWASDVNLCQVRLFLSEESPSQVGVGAQDHLQAKSSWLSHPPGTTTDDILPPGFEGGHPTNQQQIKLSDIPVIKWKCPIRFVLDLTWRVVAGDESKEVEVQNQREMRVLEAVYPRPSVIPPNPVVSSDIEDLKNNDHQVPLIPITAIEDDDASDAFDYGGPYNAPMSSQSQLLASGTPHSQYGIPAIAVATTANEKKPASGAFPSVEPDVLAAAAAPFAAINSSNDQGSLIDRDLLVKILSNPRLIEQLVQDYGPASNAQNTPKPNASFGPPSEMNIPSSFTTAAGGQFYAPANGVGPGYMSPGTLVPPPGVPASSVPPVGVPQVKDMNYYKNLIQQHGGERQETPHQLSNRYGYQVGTNQEIANNSSKSRDAKPKIMKPCVYFNSSRGCRNGANCAFQHDTSSPPQRSNSIAEVPMPNAKRMKMDREISS